MLFNLFIALNVLPSIVAFRSNSLAHNQLSFRSSSLRMAESGLPIDLKGKTVFIGGVADSTGYVRSFQLLFVIHNQIFNPSLDMVGLLQRHVLPQEHVFYWAHGLLSFQCSRWV
jgi:hypothetical protein